MNFKKISPLTLDRLRLFEKKIFLKKISAAPFITKFHFQKLGLKGDDDYLRILEEFVKKIPEIDYQFLPERKASELYGKKNFEIFEYFKNLIIEKGGVFVSGNNTVNLVGIRWMDKNFQMFPEISIRKMYLHEASEGSFYNDLLLLLFTDKYGNRKVYQTQFSASPKNLIIPDAKKKGGTAHLMDGQFVYKLGIHNTKDEEHVEFIKENLENLRSIFVKVSDKKASYSALVQRFPVVVWRSTSSLSLERDFKSSVSALFKKEKFENFAGYFGINIHLSHPEKLFSVGCQVLPDIKFYVKLITTVSSARNKDYIPYFLFI